VLPAILLRKLRPVAQRTLAVPSLEIGTLGPESLRQFIRFTVLFLKPRPINTTPAIAGSESDSALINNSMVHPNHDIQFTIATFASSLDAANTTEWTYRSRSEVDGWFGVTAPSYPR
jgi:hypothetical protein